MPSLPPLFDAAGRGDVAELAALLEAGRSVDEVLDVTGFAEEELYGIVTGESGLVYDHYMVGTPLTLAIASGRTAAAIYLLEHGASVGAQEPDQVVPPLAIAVQEGNVEVCSALLERGASPDAGYECSVLYEAAAAGNETIVRMLVSAGAGVDAEANEFGDTALHGAAASGNLLVVRYLCDRGADVLAESEQGTPADVAESVGAADVAAFLRQQAGSG